MNANTPGSNAGPMDWFNSLPKISRGYAACLVVTAACASWGMTFPFMLFLDWRSVFGGLQVRTSGFQQHPSVACSPETYSSVATPLSCVTHNFCTH